MIRYIYIYPDETWCMLHDVFPLKSKGSTPDNQVDHQFRNPSSLAARYLLAVWIAATGFASRTAAAGF